MSLPAASMFSRQGACLHPSALSGTAPTAPRTADQPAVGATISRVVTSAGASRPGEFHLALRAGCQHSAGGGRPPSTSVRVPALCRSVERGKRRVGPPPAPAFRLPRWAPRRAGRPAKRKQPVA